MRKVICEVCEGKGEYTSLDYYPPKHIEKCDECGGSGYIESEDD